MKLLIHRRNKTSTYKPWKLLLIGLASLPVATVILLSVYPLRAVKHVCGHEPSSEQIEVRRTGIAPKDGSLSSASRTRTIPKHPETNPCDDIYSEYRNTKAVNSSVVPESGLKPSQESAKIEKWRRRPLTIHAGHRG